MGTLSPDAKLPWIETPVISSRELSKAAGCNVFLKLENLQPSGSFKSRGIGNFVVRAAAASPAPVVRFYCASGGNAGLACAVAAAALGHECTIVTPDTCAPFMLDKLRSYGAAVDVHGSSWVDADRHMREDLMAADPTAVYVPPFDHQHVWDGAATIVSELVAQMPDGVDVDAIVASVGGGGLMSGILQGVDEAEAATGEGAKKAPWPKGSPPTVVAVETRGADSLNASILAGEHVALPGITSIATSLGATRVAPRLFEYAQRKARMGPAGGVASEAGPAALESLVVSDADAALACVRFVDDARFVVEPACGATLAPCYNGTLRERLGPGLSDEAWAKKNVVLVVCGGSNVTLKVLEGWRDKYTAAA